MLPRSSFPFAVILMTFAAILGAVGPSVAEPNEAPVAVVEMAGDHLDATPPETSPGYRGREVRVNLGETLVFDATGSYDPEGRGITYQWAFDDVYATDENPDVVTTARAAHTFLEEGEYNVSLTLFDGEVHGHLNVWVRTNQAPIPVPPATLFDHTDQTIYLDGSRSWDPDPEDVLRFRWDVDNEVGTEWSDAPYGNHTFEDPGTYVITMWVTDGLVTRSATSVLILDPRNHPPHAEASIREDPEDLWTNMTIEFSSAGSYDVDGEGRIAYTWDFGDGSDLSILPNPSHVYVDPGIYGVTLTVIDQKNVIDTYVMTLVVKRDYGDSDVIVKALEPEVRKSFKDPAPDEMVPAAVQRDGWVAYMCDMRKGDRMWVTVTVIGYRPADVYLFRHADFLTYMREPWSDGMTSERKGSKQGFTGEFRYEFTAPRDDRYYVVIDNRDLPPGTDTEGPVDYTIIIYPLFGIDRSPNPWRVSFWLAVVMAPVPIAVVAVLLLMKRRWC